MQHTERVLSDDQGILCLLKLKKLIYFLFLYFYRLCCFGFGFFVVLSCLFVVVLLHSPDYSGTHYVDQGGLELIETHLFLCWN